VTLDSAIRGSKLAGSRIFIALCALFRCAGFYRIQAHVALPHVVQPVGETIDTLARKAVDALDTLTTVQARS